MLASWVLLVVLTVGPIFSAQKRDGESGWFWIVAALLLGPLAGIAYYTSRHAMRKVNAAHYEPKYATSAGDSSA
jgi:hypothetical protein